MLSISLAPPFNFPNARYISSTKIEPIIEEDCLEIAEVMFTLQFSSYTTSTVGVLIAAKVIGPALLSCRMP